MLGTTRQFAQDIRQDVFQKRSTPGKAAINNLFGAVDGEALEAAAVFSLSTENPTVRAYLKKYQLSRELLQRGMLTNEDWGKLLTLPYVKSVRDLQRRLRDDLGFSQAKVDLVSAWAFTDFRAISGSRTPVNAVTTEDAEMLMLRYHEYRARQGIGDFTPEQVQKDFFETLRNLESFKSAETERQGTYKALQEAVLKKAGELTAEGNEPAMMQPIFANIMTNERLQAMSEEELEVYNQGIAERDQLAIKARQQLQKELKVYHKSQKRYFPNESFDPYLARLERQISKTEKVKRQKMLNGEDPSLENEALRDLESLKRGRVKYVEEGLEKGKFLDPRIKNRDMSFDRFLRKEQEQVFDLTNQYNNGLINQDVWIGELERRFRTEVYLYKFIAEGGVMNMNEASWEEADKLASVLRREISRLRGFSGELRSLDPGRLIGYALSVPIKIILDDINLQLLGQMENTALAHALNNFFKETSANGLDVLRGKNKDFLNRLWNQAVDSSVDFTSGTVTGWLQGQVNSYIKSNEDTARRLRATDDMLRYAWDPYLGRFVSRNAVGVSARSLMYLQQKDEVQFTRVVFRKTPEALNSEERELLQRMRKTISNFSNSNASLNYEQAAFHRKEFEELFTPEMRARINPGILYTDPETGEQKRFFIGRFVQSNQILSDADTLEFNRLLLLQRQEELTRTGRLGIAQQAQSIADFEFETVKRLKKYHILSYALGLGVNPTSFTQADYNKLTDIMTTQYRYLRDFVYDIVNDHTMSESRFLARLSQYASATALSYFAGKITDRIKSGLKQARRVVNSGESCEGCRAESAKGWVDINQVASIGSVSPCGASCKCTLEFNE